MGNTTDTDKSERSFSQDIILIDLQKWLGKLLSYWWLFLICLTLAYASGKLYLRYATFQYSARAILLIKDAGSSGVISEQGVLLNDQGNFGGSKAMDNEIQILKSLTLMERVVDRLGVEVTYFREGNFKEKELYLESPFLLESYAFNQDLVFGRSFFIELEDYNSFLLKLNEEDETGKRYTFGLPFENEFGNFLISRNTKVAIIPGTYRLTIASIENVAKGYSSKLQVLRIGDQYSSSVLELKIMDRVPEKARDLVNTLIEVYNEAEIEDENKVLRNTLEFIDYRVANLLTELDSIEGGVQNFKSANAIITDDASSSLNFALNEIRSAIQELSNFEIQAEILSSLENFLVNDKMAFDLIPANLIAENPVLADLVGQYNDLILRRSELLPTASQINPARIALENQIISIRSLILETIQNSRKDLQIPMDRLERNIEDLRKNMSDIPGVEKRLVEKMRTQSIKENLFLFLLQKREETALSEAITTAKTRTIDRARASKGPVYPKKNLVLSASMLLGFLIPLMFVILRTLFEVKIDSEDTIKALTTIPLLGRIARKKNPENIVVKPGNRSAINEMFRSLRANLSFLNLKREQQVLLVSSSVPKEGKTFITLNLGITLALSQKKVVILGMDFRKPKLGKYLGEETGQPGITNYLIGQAKLDEVLKPVEENPNLYFIGCGIIPPNPTELLLSPRMEQLFTELKSKFDYILIDSPPLNVVSDALLLRKFTDSLLLIVRHNYTRKGMLKKLEERYQNGELEGAVLIYNDIRYGQKYGYTDSYYYGYNQEYYEE